MTTFTHELAEKALAVLDIASMSPASVERRDAYRDACAVWSEKAVCAKFDELARRGYIEYGVSARTGWLTDKGKEALRGINQSERG